MQRYFLHFAYKGTNYHGWQFQRNTAQTVQQLMQDKLSLLLHEKVVLTGCGRTDTGVHAADFYAHFDSDRDNLHEEKHQWVFKMNRCLPKDIAVFGLLPVAPEANARFSAYERTYKYFINQTPDPFVTETSWYVYGPLDVELMNKAAAIIKETKDFESFAKLRNNHKHYLCEVKECHWDREGDKLIFTITANRFLRNMVRALVGTMTDLGSGKITEEDFKRIVNAGSRKEAGLSVPAQGLQLVSIKYPQHIFMK